MHELSICNAIATVVLEHADGRRVEAVQLKVGALRQIVPDSLTFCWQIVSRHPQLEGSVLKIEEVPGVVHCTTCDRRTTLSTFSLRCPACHGGMVRVVSGEECLVTSIDVATDDPATDDPATDDPATRDETPAVVDAV